MNQGILAGYFCSAQTNILLAIIIVLDGSETHPCLHDRTRQYRVASFADSVLISYSERHRILVSLWRSLTDVQRAPISITARYIGI